MILMEMVKLDIILMEINWLPEPNVDEPDENIPQKTELSIFPIIPTIGFSIEF